MSTLLRCRPSPFSPRWSASSLISCGIAPWDTVLHALSWTKEKGPVKAPSSLRTSESLSGAIHQISRHSRYENADYGEHAYDCSNYGQWNNGSQHPNYHQKHAHKPYETSRYTSTQFYETAPRYFCAFLTLFIAPPYRQTSSSSSFAQPCAANP